MTERHIVLHMGIHTLCNYARGSTKMGSQVDINTCTDGYTHSKQGVGPEVG